MVKRFEDWPKRLSRFIKEHKKSKFVWGENDCIMFAAKCLECLTGENFYSEYVGYSTKEEAYKILELNGGFEGIISKHIGRSHRNYKKARRGDLVLLKLPEMTCGVVDDSGQFVVATGEEELKRVSLDKAWRIWSY